MLIIGENVSLKVSIKTSPITICLVSAVADSALVTPLSIFH